MKLMFASDIHGSVSCCKKMLERFKEENAGQLILLGDLLYHGPRNPLPENYSPAETAELLNGISEYILCVRGNCEAEVDQMMLDFPVLADYAALFTEDGRTVYCTHGHLFKGENKLPIKRNSIIIEGHSHIYTAEKREDHYYINTGSVTLPKNGNQKSYVIYENGRFSVRNMSGSELSWINIQAPAANKNITEI